MQFLSLKFLVRHGQVKLRIETKLVNISGTSRSSYPVSQMQADSQIHNAREAAGRSGCVARALPGWRVAHPDCQNGEEHEQSLRKNKKIYRDLRKNEESETLQILVT